MCISRQCSRDLSIPPLHMTNPGNALMHTVVLRWALFRRFLLFVVCMPAASSFMNSAVYFEKNCMLTASSSATAPLGVPSPLIVNHEHKSVFALACSIVHKCRRDVF